MNSIDVVKLQARRLKPSGTQYAVTVPSSFVKELGWEKGIVLVARILEIEIEGRKRRALVYYKAE